MRTSFVSAQVIIEPNKESTLARSVTFQVRTHFSDSSLLVQLAQGCNQKFAIYKNEQLIIREMK